MTKNIILIGIMGCGKTTIGQMLAKKLNMEFIDIDEYVEQTNNMTISDMFKISEDYFRDKETLACKELAHLQGYVISTGGGVITHKENMEALRVNGVSIYIHRPLELITSNIEIAHRPLLKNGPEKLYDLQKKRHPLYLEASDYVVENDQDLDQVCQIIMEYYKK